MKVSSPAAFWAEAPSGCWLVVDDQYRIVAAEWEIQAAVEQAVEYGRCVVIWSPPKAGKNREELKLAA